MYKILKMREILIYFFLLTNYINYISTTLDVLEPKDKNKLVSQNEFELYRNLKEVHKDLHSFIGSKLKISINMLNSNYLNNRARIATENYTHFEAAQNLILKLADKLTYKGPYQNDYLYRENRLKFLFGVTLHLSPGVIICKYISILENLYIAYYISYLSKVRALKADLTQKFISSLAFILKELHLCEYIMFFGKSAAYNLYIYKSQDSKPGSPKALKEQAFKSIVENSHIIFYKVLIIAYQWQMLYPTKRNIRSEYNPLSIGYRIVKSSEFLACDMERTLAIILNYILINAFNQAGLEIIDKKSSVPLLFYCEKNNMIKGVDLKDLIFLEYKGLTKMPGNLKGNRSIVDMTSVIDFFYTKLSYNSKEAVTIQLFNLILQGSKKIHYIAMIDIWICFNRKHMEWFIKPVNDLILSFLSTEISTFSEKYKDYYTEICQQTFLNIIWDLYIIYIRDGIYSDSLTLMKDFYRLSELLKSPNYNTLYIFENQLELLSKLLTINICDSKKRILSIAEKALNGLSNRAINICRPYNITEYTINIKNILTSVAIILTQGLKLFDLEMILTNIEDFLCNQELRLFPQFDFEDILQAITNISDFTKYVTKKKYKISDYNRERIGNIVFKFFFIIIDLDIILKEPIKGNTCGDNLRLILDYLANRKFASLIFTEIERKLLLPASTKKSVYNMYFNFMKYLYCCNILPSKRSLGQINTIFIDVLQIRLRLLKDFSSLTESILYNLLIQTESQPKIYLDQVIFSNVESSHDSCGEEYCEFFFDFEIISTFIISPKNDFELILTTFLNVLLTLRRLESNNIINLLQLQKLVEEMNTLNFRMDHFDDSIFIFNECGFILFTHAIIAIKHFCPSSNYSKAIINNFKINLNKSLFSIINKLHDSLTKNQASSKIDFYIFLGLSKVNTMNFENLEGFKELKNRLKEGQTEYFKFFFEQESIEIVCINILFTQLLSFMNMNISEKYKDRLATYPYIEDIEGYHSQYSIDRFIFSLKNPKDINCKHPEYMNDGIQGFFYLFTNQISNYSEICKFVLQALIERFRLTVNYESDCLPYCYLLYSLILGCDLKNKCLVINLDELFAKHIENCNLEDSFKILCDIIKLHINDKLYHNSLYQHEFLLSLTAAYDRSRKMQWDHPLLSEY